jgi:hypothetical protein
MQAYEPFTQVNDSIRAIATEGEPDETWEFYCECADVNCHGLISLTLLEFDERRRSTPPIPILDAQHVD